MNSTFCALKKVHPSKQTFFGQMNIEKQPAIGSEHFTVGLFAMCQHGFWYWQPDQAIYDQGLKNLARMILQEL